ncbi:peptidase domain-containing ABC transporter [Epibacterium sp. Ofav1-8]|uniref:peptidase domain-containing ABC transporter n=1 Tax=Epibacterium sp. Ofav1-8 TaxID=2917735 RepID=UPI001EF3D9B0|nr:peptidase domain-containing ABC transporter [Epibacterium sp. Ofav1-8]MCG7626092.1 peptidase domain-containing ABC transporter [Epibacterium sp. Ofav1-8]
MTLHTGVRCLCLVGRQKGVDLGAERLIHDFALNDTEPSPALLMRMARENGLKAGMTTLKPRRLERLTDVWPVVAVLAEGRYVLLTGLRDTEEGSRLTVLDPAQKPIELQLVDPEVIYEMWDGKAILLKAASVEARAGTRKFGLGYFVSEVSRYKGLFTAIAMIAIVMHGLNLAVPIFFQIVMDKVLQNGSVDTLNVLTAGMVILLVLSALMGYFRTRLLLQATNRIDIRLATRVFGKLLSLPLDFFEQRSAGVTAKHASQHTQIRNFLTGRLFNTILELSALIVFIPVLALYSGTMTLIVLGFAMLIGLVMLSVMKPYHNRLQELYAAEGDRQSLLIETLNGIRTTKALALEPPRRRQWDSISANVVRRGLDVGKIGALSGEITKFLEKAMSVCLIFVGVRLVLNGELTVGALVAFNMLSQRVSGPLVQMVSLIKDWQEVRVSLSMMGGIMDRPSEQRRSRALTPDLKGMITAENVGFTYPNGTSGLSGASFEIRAGEFVGVVGRSGSGKSTLTRMLQGFHIPDQGVIRFDRLDMRQIELPYLRSSMGVVPQDSFLFRGTIAENLRATLPNASLEDIIEAAVVAGAHDFIEALPEGYDTMVEENSSNLSGGQRQRIAIARAILRDPKIIIMDEATSALDPESEAVLMENLPQICEGRTTIMVTHRLGQLMDADKIIVMDGGKVVDCASHTVLLSRCALYQALWSRQYGRIETEVNHVGRPAINH